MLKRLIIVSMMVLALGTLMVGPAVAQSGDFCYQATLRYSNNTGSTQTIYVTRIDPIFNEVLSNSEQVATVQPGGSVSEDVQVILEDEASFDFVFSTQPANDFSALLNSSVAVSGTQPCSIFTDGRLNWYTADAPVIVYNEDNIAFSFYAVNQINGVGTEVLRVPLARIRPAVDRALDTGENILITERLGISVYALSAGTCQMNVFRPNGTLYEFEWYCYI